MTKTCFIISSIGKEGSEVRAKADEKFDLIFKPVLSKMDYQVTRADKIGSPGSISREIVERVINSDLVIADVSDENPNVFYELAIRNAVKKSVIVFKGLNQSMPFDIYDKRAISIDRAEPRVWESAKEQLEAQVKEAENKPELASESIVFDYAFSIKPREQPISNIDMLVEVVRDLQQEVRRLRWEQELRPPNLLLEQSAFTKTSNVGLRVSIPHGSGASQECVKTGKCFIPSVIMIQVGTMITWTNDDVVGHTVTSGLPSDNQTGAIFDSSLIPAQKRYSFIFTQTGTFKYFCMVHPWQVGQVTVVASPPQP
jgi:plastocyanin